MIMHPLPAQPRILVACIFFFIVLTSGALMPPATGADVSIEGFMGDTIPLHGFLYVGDSVYLFLTGPGLPENGVTLTDISQRADQGHFTVVRVDENQEWTYFWKTSRIDSEIDPGTYVVYVMNKPSDLSHLGGSSSYKTFEVFLKDSGISKVSIDAQRVYTRNPKEQVSISPLPEPSINITNATPADSSAPPSGTIFPTTVPATAPAPTTRAGTVPVAAVTALIGCAWLISFLKIRP